MKRLAQLHLSAAVFAPAWPHEHFAGAPDEGKSQAEYVEGAMWEGTDLPQRLDCDCIGNPHQWLAYKENSICGSARSRPSGSRCYLESDFQKAFVKIDRAGNEVCLPKSDFDGLPFLISTQLPFQSMLGFQAPMPRCLEKSGAACTCTCTCTCNKLEGIIGDDSDRSYLVVTISSCQICQGGAEYACVDAKNVNSPEHAMSRLSLFNVSMPRDRPLTVSLRMRAMCSLEGLSIGFFTKSEYDSLTSLTYENYPIKCLEPHLDKTFKCNIPCIAQNARIVEVGIYCGGVGKVISGSDLMQVYNLVIQPQRSYEGDFRIADIEIRQRRAGLYSSKRLAWNWYGLKAQWPLGLPWSDVTGPFAYFTIWLNGWELGRASCLEMPLHENDLLNFEDERNVFVEVQGYFFGGEKSSISRVSVSSMAFSEE